MKLGSKSYRFRDAVGLVFITQVLGAGLSYAMHIVLSRSLAPAEYGAVAYVLAWVLFLGVLATGGLPDAALRFVRTYLHTKSTPAAALYWSWSVKRLLLVGSLTIAAGALGASILFVLGARTYAFLILLLSILIPSSAFAEFSSAIGRCIERPVLAFAPQRVGLPFVVIAGAGLAAMEEIRLVAVSTLAGYTLVSVLVSGGQFLAVRGAILADTGTDTHEQADAATVKGWQEVSSTLWGVTALALALKYVNVLLLGALAGTRSVAIFTAAAKTAGLAGFVLAAVNAVIAPYFSTLVDRRENTALQALLEKAVRWIAGPTLVIAAAIALFSEPLMSLFGPEFSSAGKVLVILVGATVVNALCGPVGLLLKTTGHQAKSLRIFAFCLALDVLVAVPLILGTGVIGAAATEALILVLWNVWMRKTVRTELGVESSFLQLLPERRS